MNHKIFGIKENAEYSDREGAYLIPCQNDRIGIVKTPKGYFLLGGGLENGESHAECIKRECLEEVGYTVSVKNKICSAEAYHIHSEIGYFHPIQTYYAGELLSKVSIPVEKDHTLLWVEFDEIKGKMFSDMQNWALEKLSESISNKNIPSGIAVMGLNGSGKSTLTHELCKKLDFYEMDVEDYYFPEQKNSRQAILEHTYDGRYEYRGEFPYSEPRTKSEVQEMLREDIKKHPRFILSGVTMNWEADILSSIGIAFILDVPTEERVKRVQEREEIRFGSRVITCGDMYEQQKRFKEMISSLDIKKVTDSADKMSCKKVWLDGTKSIEENVKTVTEILNGTDIKNAI